MRVAINGMGVAGPALAWWLKHFGHEPVLFEKSPHLRTGGYLTDFWGIGYDVAERMGILPELQKVGYLIDTLRMVNDASRTVAHIDVARLRRLVKDRFFSLARGDLAATIFRACAGVESHFGESIVRIEQSAAQVMVGTSTGAQMPFDLVVGADGLHSEIRRLVFGPDQLFERRLGLYVAAFALTGYRPREEEKYVSRTIPQRQVARVALRGDATMFLFIFREEAAGGPVDPGRDPKEVLRAVFGDMNWEVPQILARMEEAGEIYFDDVSQIRMETWVRGRVALMGDAAACVSLLAGEGTGLALAEAYVMAGELHRTHGNLAGALAEYEKKLRPLLAAKQKAALGFAGFFAPRSPWGLFLRNQLLHLLSLPFMARLFVGRALRDNFVLPAYDDGTGNNGNGGPPAA